MDPQTSPPAAAPGQPPGQPSGSPPGQALQAPQHAAMAVHHEITHGPSFAMLRADIQPGQTVVAEAGAMVARHNSVEMDVKMNSSRNAGFLGVMKAFFIALIRKVVGGETFFVNHFTCTQPGSVWIAPTLAGQVTHRQLQGETLTLSTGAFVAMSGNVDMRLKFGGLRSLFAKEGAFFLELSGHGDLWFTSYGGIHAVDINGPFMVDNGHLVGYEGNVTFAIKSAGGGAMGLLASGEGLVCEFNGQGRVYLQSRNLGSLVGWLSPLLPG